MLYQRSKTTKGSGEGIVAATRDQTEYGKIIRQL